MTEKFFALAVNIALKRAHELIQIAVRKGGDELLDINGMLGDLSLKAINGHQNPGLLLSRVQFEAKSYCVNLHIRFFAGL